MSVNTSAVPVKSGLITVETQTTAKLNKREFEAKSKATDIEDKIP